MLTEQILKDIFEETSEDMELLKKYLDARDRLKRKPTMLAKEVYRKLLQEISPTLAKLEITFTNQCKQLDRENYKKTKKISTKSSDKLIQLEIKIKVCNIYQRPLIKK